MMETIQNTNTSTIETGTCKLNQELTKEEKKARNRLYYLKFIEKCRNHEFLTTEERKATDRTLCATISPEDKKETLAIRRRLITNRHRFKHKEEWNAYMRTRMREKYRNDEPYRTNQLTKAKIRRALKKAAANAQNLAPLSSEQR